MAVGAARATEPRAALRHAWSAGCPPARGRAVAGCTGRGVRRARARRSPRRRSAHRRADVGTARGPTVQRAASASPIRVSVVTFDDRITSSRRRGRRAAHNHRDTRRYRRTMRHTSLTAHALSGHELMVMRRPHGPETSHTRPRPFTATGSRMVHHAGNARSHKTIRSVNKQQPKGSRAKRYRHETNQTEGEEAHSHHEPELLQRCCCVRVARCCRC